MAYPDHHSQPTIAGDSARSWFWLVAQSHSFADHGNVVRFGDPITVEPIPSGNTAVFRIANNDSGTETVGGWIVWSFQEQI